MSKELNKALDLLREIRPSIPKDVLELWCKDRDAFLASHKAPVEQAGGDERAAFFKHLIGRHPAHETEIVRVVEHNYAAWKAWQARAALAQPSPASDLDPFNLAPHAEAFNEAPDEALKPEQAEAERPEVVGSLYLGCWADQEELEDNDVELDMKVVERLQVDLASKGDGVHMPLMTVAQHERIAASRWERAMDLMGEHVARISEKLTKERDAALARVAEWRAGIARAIERASVFDDGSDGADAESARSVVAILSELLAQAQHSVPVTHEFKRALGLVVAALEADGDRPTSKYALSKLKKVLAAAPGKEA